MQPGVWKRWVELCVYVLVVLESVGLLLEADRDRADSLSAVATLLISGHFQM